MKKAKKAISCMMVLLMLLNSGYAIAGGVADSVQLAYDSAIMRLCSSSLTDRESLESIYQNFSQSGVYLFSIEYRMLTEALLSMLGEDADQYEDALGKIRMISENKEFFVDYAGYRDDSGKQILPELDSIIQYIKARKLELYGYAQDALELYKSFPVLDAMEHAQQLSSEILKEKYEQALTLMSTETMESVQQAVELFRSLGDYKESEWKLEEGLTRIKSLATPTPPPTPTPTPIKITSEISGLMLTAESCSALSISWTECNPGTYRYTISYQPVGAENFKTAITNMTSTTIQNLAPNTTYLIVVSTIDGNSKSKAITMPNADQYSKDDYKCNKCEVYRIKIGDDAFEDPRTLAETIQFTGLRSDLDSYNYCIYTSFDVSATQIEKYLHYLVVIRLPDDNIYTTSDTDHVEDKAGTSILWWTSIGDTLKEIYSDYNTYPIGVYTITVYIDDQYAAETSITMQ